MTFDPETAASNPSAYYNDPQQVLDDSRLTTEQKHRALKAMEADAIELLTADDENMLGGERMDLNAIRLALQTLDTERS